MSQIDVLIVVDTKTIVASEKVLPGTIYMFTDRGNVSSEYGSAGLKLNVLTGDEIRWQATSLDIAYAVVFCGFYLQPPLPPPLPPRLISPPQGSIMQMRSFRQSSCSSVQCQKISTYIWTSDVLDSGGESYYFTFAIIGHNNKLEGRYQSDPLIIIESG